MNYIIPNFKISELKALPDLNQNLNALILLGNCCLKMNISDKKLALENFKLAEKLEPDNQTVKFNISLIYLSMSEYHQSIRNFKAALLKEPLNIKFRYNLGKSKSISML